MSLTKAIVDRLFSYRGVNLRTNIIGSGGSTSFLSSKFNNRSGGVLLPSASTISGYLETVQDLREFQLTDLTKTIIESYKNFFLDYLKQPERNIISINSGAQLNESVINKVNEYLSSLSIQEVVTEVLDNFLYWGSTAKLLKWDSGKRKFIFSNLVNPNAIIVKLTSSEVTGYIIQDADGGLQQIEPEYVFYIGNPTWELQDDITESIIDQGVDTLEQYKVALPMYYSIIGKVKEYVLNDKLNFLINIKDLLQPLLLLINCDKNTDVSTANNLANNLETLINKYVDITTIMSAREPTDSLVDAIINNVRVMPDYNGLGAAMTPIDLSKLKEKADAIRSDQESRREIILNSLSLTLDYVQGRSTKWDALRQSEKLTSVISTRIQELETSVCKLACNIYWLLTKQHISVNDIRCNLFTETTVELSKCAQNLDATSNVVSTALSILESSQSFLRNSDLVDRVKFIDFIKDKLNNVDVNLGALISDSAYNEPEKDKEDDYN